MRIIAAIQADLEVTPLGTRSCLADELRGVPVLRRTVDRVAAIDAIESIHVACPSSQLQRCRRLLGDAQVELHPCDAGPPPWAALVRTSRKWSLDAWRGGIGGTTVFDEYTDARVIEGMARIANADAALVVAPGAVVLDAQLAERMIERRKSAGDEVRMVFAATPPGLSGLLIDTSLLAELVQQNLPIGWLFGYQPDQPRKDPIFLDCCLEVPASVRFSSGRLIADTQRSMRRLADLLADHPSSDAPTAGEWLMRREDATVEPLPREVEIELTTDDPCPDALLRPRGGRVPCRGPIDLGIVRKVAEELTAWDDSLIVFGGFGDPLRHPRFAETLSFRGGPPSLVQGVRNSEGQVFGLCVRTAGADLTDANIAAMIENRVDVLSVILDAWSPALYAALHTPGATGGLSASVPSGATGGLPASAPSGATGGLPASAPPDLDRVRAMIERVAALRADRRTVCPIVVPEMTKSRENVAELEAFYDGWMRSLGSVCISGASHYARQLDDHAVMNMAPSPRGPCRRLRSRCLILADGRVAACDQDFRGLHTVGDLHKQTLAEIWTGPTFTALRDAHRTARFDVNPLCAACDEWHRP